MQLRRYEVAIRDTKFSVIDFEGSLTPSFVAREMNEELPPERLCSNPNKILDIGANTGMWSFYMARHFPDARIIAVEPSEINYQSLRCGIKENGFDNITPLPLAISNHHAIRLGMDMTNSGSASEFLGGDNFESFTSPAICLNDLLNLTGPVSLMKLDIEGGEFSVFNGFTRWSYIGHLVLEVHPWLAEPDEALRKERTKSLVNLINGWMPGRFTVTSSDSEFK